ncbi:MAG: hypothetical protein IIA09_14740 [Proteobacteria bacterium]|nr:hypothetical protein [Pseudomonadota bacterium]
MNATVYAGIGILYAQVGLLQLENSSVASAAMMMVAGGAWFITAALKWRRKP